jgi:acyl-homoserine-lactone acylase
MRPTVSLHVPLIIILLIFSSIKQAVAQVDPDSVTIARDRFGVPHIYGRTDADAAFGLAWAHSEDDFISIQENLLAGKGMLGRVKGKDGVLFDFGLQFLSIDSLVNARYEKDLSPAFRRVVEGYAQGINAYAKANPNEVILKKALPFTAKDVICGYVLNTTLMAGVGLTLKAVTENKLDEIFSPNDVGSNALAIAPHRTDDSTAWLVINSHQPTEGRFAWYEAHIRSDQGWDIIGGLFPGGVSIFVGSNPHLGWAHTNNYHTFGDVFVIEQNPQNRKQYRFDGKWVNYRERKLKLKVKVAGMVIGVKKKVQYTQMGPVMETKHGKYAIRFPSYTDIRAAEQWYRMNKATDLNQFEAAMRMHALPLFNTVYADKDGNIFLNSGGKVPVRDTTLNWKVPIHDCSSSYCWNEIIPFDAMPMVKNPDCGYVFNANGTPLSATGEECNYRKYFLGLQLFDYNRNELFRKRMEGHEGRFSWADVHRIKFDKGYLDDGSYARNFRHVYGLDEARYPEIAPSIRKLKAWNRQGDADNPHAALAMVMHKHLSERAGMPFGFLMISKQPVSETDAVWAIGEAQKFLQSTHGTIDVKLGDVQRHIRGQVNIPASGLREVPRATDSSLHDKRKGIYRTHGGDGYIQMTRFSAHGPEVLSINAFGASAKPESPHYTDQMIMFQNEEFKKMTFDWDEIRREAERVYHPK